MRKVSSVVVLSTKARKNTGCFIFCKSHLRRDEQLFDTGRITKRLKKKYHFG